jgi:hypothetical protein
LGWWPPGFRDTALGGGWALFLLGPASLVKNLHWKPALPSDLMYNELHSWPKRGAVS